jgi:hypothetical protein
MEIRLIFLSQLEVDGFRKLHRLIGLYCAVKEFQEIAPTLMAVPQTDTGGRGEYPKALERTWVKELGKIVP